MKVLHVGCGRDSVHQVFSEWKETRVDINPDVCPDIVADLADLGDIGQFDAVYGAHVLEHFEAHRVAKVLDECWRVLKVGGFVMMVVPNLAGIRPDRSVVYEADAGPITGLDMYYGKESMIEANPYMAHRTGFVKETLEQALSGFELIKVTELSGFNLLGVGVKTRAKK